MRRAFTLIELMIAISIIGVLMSMLMPLVMIAQRAAKKSATRSVMVKVDTALRLFRADFGPYPWQESYADLAARDPWTNRLYYHLGTTMDPAEFEAVRNDADTAAAHYEDFTGPISPSAFILWDLWGAASTDGRRFKQNGATRMLNRMAAERARLAIYSGNNDITTPVLPIPWVKWQDVWSGRHTVRIVKPTTPLLTTPTATKLGMASDYLSGEMEKRYVSGEAILDGWKRPLIYVCQVVEGMTSQPTMSGDGVMGLSALEWGMQPGGRRTLSDKDAITATPITDDPPFLPDKANLRHSDRRRYAAPNLELEFELWSAGPDGHADWMRDAAVNFDNVSLLPYDKNIP